MNATHTHVGPASCPAQLGANPDPLAWGLDPSPHDIAAAIMSTWAPNAPGTHYAPGFSAAEVTRLAVLRFSTGDGGLKSSPPNTDT